MVHRPTSGISLKKIPEKHRYCLEIKIGFGKLPETELSFGLKNGYRAISGKYGLVMIS
jgi:hypothetical protein